MKILTWNLEWAPLGSKREKLITTLIAQIDPDVVCYTEVNRNTIPDGHIIEADPDYGYPHNGQRLKVLLWSKHPWKEVDTVGDPDLPTGRYASGITQDIRFIGVCIPWKDAHVRNGRKDREPWQDHLAYCEGLSRIIEAHSASSHPICILGDYNQRIPRLYQPEHIAKALLHAIPNDFTFITQGLKDNEDKQLIDHICVSPSLTASATQILPHTTPDGTRLTDHMGVLANIEKE